MSDVCSKDASDTQLSADALVLGGVPAGVWAALSAAEQGLKVILAEKGFVGTVAPLPPGIRR